MMCSTTSPRPFRCLRILSVVLVAMLLKGASLNAQDIQPEFLMLSDPQLQVPASVTVLPEGAILLWQNALSVPEPDLVQGAADSIADAHSQGFPGLDSCGPELMNVLTFPVRQPAVTFAVSRALIVLNESNAANLLFQESQEGNSQLRMLIEPALAKWAYQPAIDLWVKRLNDQRTQRRELILACEGVTTTGSISAVPFLVDIALDRSRPGDLRLTAARAAGSIASGGLADKAALLEGAGAVEALCAIALLGRDSGQTAQNLLTTLASHENSAIAAAAMRSLLNISADLMLPFADVALEDSDPMIRQCGLDTYVALMNEVRLPLVAGMLTDAHPEVRMNARQHLFALSDNNDMREQIIDQVMQQLAGEDWRGQEQATLLLVALDHKAAATRLVELLGSERPEVMVTSAWGLRMLAVPETADGIIKKIERESIAKPSIPYGDLQVGHLFEACAVLGEHRALESIPRYLPRDVTREKSRSAAVWAAGKLLEGQPDEMLANALMDRVKDINDNVEELALVRQMSAISIGRMQATSQLQPLKDFLGPEIYATPVAHAIGWAIERLSGEKLPVTPATVTVRRGWPLEPSSTDQ